MKKLVILVVLACAGLAGAQPAEPAAGSAAPAAGSAAPAAGSAAPAADAPAAPPASAQDAEELRKTCAAALNANPEFAKAVVATYDKKAVELLDKQTLEQHTSAAAQVAENERHVIYAYAAMWILAALFLVYMWMRQQSLKNELLALRRELDAAAKDSK
jgi:hypothetical protein